MISKATIVKRTMAKRKAAKAAKKKAATPKLRHKLDPSILSPQEDAFCGHYVLHGNAYQAYMHAFPRAKTWKRTTVDEFASRLVATSKVQARLSVLRMKVRAMAEEEFEIDARWVLKEIATVARQHVPDVIRWGKKKLKRQVYRGKDETGTKKYEEVEIEVDYLEATPSGELTEDQAKAVQSAKMNVDKFGNTHLEIVFHDRFKALEKLAQFTGLTAGKIVHEHTGKIVHAAEPAVKQIENASDEREALKIFEAFRTGANSYAIEHGKN